MLTATVTDPLARNNEQSEEDYIIHEVTREDYPWTIADFYWCTIEDIKAINNLTHFDNVKFGEKFKIPLTPGIKSKSNNKEPDCVNMYFLRFGYAFVVVTWEKIKIRKFAAIVLSFFKTCCIYSSSRTTECMVEAVLNRNTRVPEIHYQ